MKKPKRIQTSADCKVFDKAAVDVRPTGSSHVVCKMADGGTVVYPDGKGKHKTLSPGLQCHLTKVARYYNLLAVVAVLFIVAALVVL